MAQEEEDGWAYDPDPQEEEVWIGSSSCQHQGDNYFHSTIFLTQKKVNYKRTI